MKEFLKQLKLIFFPETIKDVWYNAPAHMSNKEYTVFDKNGNYIPCKVGLKILFNNGKVYEVTSMWKDRPYSDWLYPSDCIQCNLERIK